MGHGAALEGASAPDAARAASGPTKVRSTRRWQLDVSRNYAVSKKGDKTTICGIHATYD